MPGWSATSPDAHPPDRRAAVRERARRVAPGAGPLLATALAMVLGGCDLRDEVGRPPRTPTTLTGVGRLLDRPSGPTLPRAGTTGTARTTVALVEGYDAAARRARDDGLRLVLVFKATWCRHSALLVSRTLTDPRIVARAPGAVWAVIDADREPAVCRRFGVTAFPTVITVDETGVETRRLVGKPSAVELAGLLELPPAHRGERIASEADDRPR